ncbi:MAG: imidazole glycerol phosphate synthase subunit HisF [Ignavibacteriales bacterium]|nr:imidazole glycerol phosphate synthase subunit HisF [Ignavibacteriales bacterium]
MVSKRIIPCLDVKDGIVVKGTNFVNLVEAGDAVDLAKRYVLEGADELVFLDITASVEKRKILIHLVEEVARAIQIPFTVGGGITDLYDIENLLKAGADKVSLNSSIVKDPSLISRAAKQVGSQAVVAAIDVKSVNGKYKVFVKGGREETELEGFEWCWRAADLGAGEILLTSMDKDGTKSGYDNIFLKKLKELVSIPVIASGGAGRKEDFLDTFRKTDVDACLAASLFHFDILKIRDLKNYLNENNIKVRL